jgi:hypothetical protein
MGIQAMLLKIQRSEMPTWLLLAWAFVSLVGCCGERVYRCDNGSCGMLSGRCGDASGTCHICGRAAGHCLGHPWLAIKEAIHCKGCGDCYWDEWYSDPPDECDPCDDCGNHIGPRCCPPKRLHGVYEHLKGKRFCDTTCGPAGCGTEGCSEVGYDEGDVVFDDGSYAEESYDAVESIPQHIPQTHPKKATTPQKTTPRKSTPPADMDSMEPAETTPETDVLPMPRSRSLLPGDDAESSTEENATPLKQPSVSEPEAKKPTGVRGKTVAHQRQPYAYDFEASSPPKNQYRSR